MRFNNIGNTTTEDVAKLFSILTEVNNIAYKLTGSDLDEEAGLIVKSISLNSPLKMELIASGFGIVLLILQIVDLSGNFLLEREKLELETKKLRAEIEKIEIDSKNERRTLVV